MEAHGPQGTPPSPQSAGCLSRGAGCLFLVGLFLLLAVAGSLFKGLVRGREVNTTVLIITIVLIVALVAALVVSAIRERRSQP